MAEIITVKTDRFEMDVSVFGHGAKNFIMLPGVSIKPVSLSAEAVAEAYRLFWDDFTVYLFDRKKDFGETYSVEDMARDSAEAMERLGLHDCYLFGASQGGMIALEMALRYPWLANRVFLASSACRCPPEGTKLLLHWAELAEKGDCVAVNRSMFSVLYSAAYLEKYKDIIAVLEQQGSPEELHRLAVLCRACVEYDCYDELTKIKCPVMAVGAEHDSVFPGNVSAREIADRLGCGLYIYPDYRHAVYDEAPDYREKIMDFFMM